MRVLPILAVLCALASCKKNDSSSESTIPSEGKQQLFSVKQTNIQQQMVEYVLRQNSGPSVVLISGFNSPVQNWEKVYSHLNPKYTIFSYNRAGTGNSSNLSGKRDAETIVAEMKAYFDHFAIKPPYTLVAHSMGGIYARLFYHKYPMLVKGIVLVDATHENQIDSALSLLPEEVAQEIRAGIKHQNDSILSTMPDGAIKEEFRANAHENYVQIKKYPPIQNLPLYVLNSMKPSGESSDFILSIKSALHRQWAEKCGIKGFYRETTRSGHFIQLDEPELVNEAIDWVLKQQ